MSASSASTASLKNNTFESLETRTVRSVNPIVPPISEAVFSAPDTTEIEVASTANQVSAAGQLVQPHAVASVESYYGLSGYGQTVAVIDTGIAWDQQALGGGLGSSYRVVGGWDFAESDADPYDGGSRASHGTHVAGIIGSDDLVHRGIAPGSDLVGLRVFDDHGNGSFAWIESALAWVHQHRLDYEFPITTVNISVGTNWNDAASTPYWSTLEDEFAQLHTDGIFVAVSAGNSFRSYNTAGLSYPASSPYVVPVASVGGSSLASYSQRHDRVLAAPGQNISSTVPDHKGNNDGIDNDFRRMSGTSMASPYVAGASAVLREAMLLAGRTDVDQDDLYFHFRDTADMVYDSVTRANYHRINLDRAIEQIMPPDEAGGSTDPNQLHSLKQETAVQGMLTSLADQDYYSFVASESGKAELHFDWLGHERDQPQFTWNGQSLGEGASVVYLAAGQTYTFGVTQPQSIGRYEIVVRMESDGSSPIESPPPGDTGPPHDPPREGPSSDVPPSDNARPPIAPIATPIARSETYLTWSSAQSGYFKVDLDIDGVSLAESVVLTRGDGREIIRFSGSVGDQHFYMAGQAGQRYEMQISSQVPVSFSFQVSHDDFSGGPLTNSFAFATASYRSVPSGSTLPQSVTDFSEEAALEGEVTRMAVALSMGGQDHHDGVQANVSRQSQAPLVSDVSRSTDPVQHGLAMAMDAIDRAIVSIHPDVGPKFGHRVEEIHAGDDSVERLWKDVSDLFDRL